MQQSRSRERQQTGPFMSGGGASVGNEEDGANDSELDIPQRFAGTSELMKATARPRPIPANRQLP